MSYDLYPVTVMEEKAALLDRAYTEGWVLLFEHDAHVESCRIQRDGKRFTVADVVPSQPGPAAPGRPQGVGGTS
jgi:hypothetical protein